MKLRWRSILRSLFFITRARRNLKRKETVCEQPRQAISGFISQRTQANVKVNSPPYEHLKILLEF